MAAGGYILERLNVLRGVREYLPEEGVFQLSLEDEMRVVRGRREAQNVQSPCGQQEHSAEHV